MEIGRNKKIFSTFLKLEDERERKMELESDNLEEERGEHRDELRIPQ